MCSIRRLGFILWLGLGFWAQFGHAAISDNAQGLLTTSFKGDNCGFSAAAVGGTPAALGSNDHVAKFDCVSGNSQAGLAMVRRGDRLFVNINGSQCGLGFNRQAGTPSTVFSHEHVAQFDCSGNGDPLQFDGSRINAVINGRLCGLQVDGDTGTPGVLGSSERVAKFDCRFRGNNLTFTASAINTDTDTEEGGSSTRVTSDERSAQGLWFRSSGQDVETNRNPSYILRLNQTEFVTIDLESNDTDAYLFVVARGLQTSFEDDNGGDGTNARFEGFLSRGEYILIAGTRDKNQSGTFTIRSSEGTLDGLHVEWRTESTQGEEEDYYEAIDPNDRKLTLDDWFDENGFNDFRSNVLQTHYYNKGDLGLGRGLKCVEEQERLACVTSNFGAPGDLRIIDEALADSINETNTLAHVAMEYDPADNLNPVKFYVYSGDGQTRLEQLQLDNQEAKSVPGVCLNCHGGTYDDRRRSVEGAAFLPFDLETFEFAEEDFSEAAQSELFREANAMVKRTNPNNAVAELIDGWYGGDVERGGALFNRNYVPPRWESEVLQYTYVVKPYCRGCHVGIDLSLEKVGQVYPAFFEDYICGYVEDGPIMPHAEFADRQFWDDESAVRLAVSNYTDCRRTRFGQ